jgi:hypothetical protein
LWLDSIHSPDIRQPFSPDSIHSPNICQPFPRTRYIRSHSTFAIFEKNVTRLDTFARVIRHFGKFGASGHCLVFFNKNQNVKYFFNCNMKASLLDLTSALSNLIIKLEIICCLFKTYFYYQNTWQLVNNYIDFLSVFLKYF